MPVEARGTSTTSPPTGRGSGGLERVTVNLTPRAARALEAIVALRGDSNQEGQQVASICSRAVFSAGWRLRSQSCFTSIQLEA